MDWKTFSIEFLRVISWPLIALTIIILFRKPLSLLASNLRRVKLGNIAEFEVTEIQKALDKAAPQAIAESTEILDHFMKLAVLSPRTAIIEKWKEVETSIFKAGERNYPTIEHWKEMTASQIVNSLFEAEKISKEIRDAFFRLKRWRDDIAYFSQTPVEPNDALTFANLARDLQMVFDAA